jgi:hypothetical protein
MIYRQRNAVFAARKRAERLQSRIAERQPEKCPETGRFARTLSGKRTHVRKPDTYT